MLDPDDADLARRDRDVPGLGSVLDPDAVAALADRLGPDLAVRGARADYVRRKPGTSCVVRHVLDTASGPVLVAALAVRPSAADKLGKTLELAQRRVHGGLPAEQDWAAVDVDAGLALFTPSRDRRLPALRELAGRRSRAALLARVGVSDGAADAPTTLRWKPGRRWVGVLPDARPPVALRAVADATASGWRHDAPGVRRPTLRGEAPELGLLATSWVDGTPVDVLERRQEAGPALLGEVGAALAALHQADPTGLAPAGPDVTAAAAAVATLLPHLAEPASRLARREDVPSPSCTVHGDFSLDQVLRTTDGGVALLDLDAVGAGDPVQDLASLAAALHVEARRPGCSGTAPDDVAAVVLDGYLVAGGPAVVDRLPSALAAALLQRAAEPFRLRWPGWPEHVEAVVEAAARAAGGAAP